MSNIFSESTMQVIIEVLVDKIKGLQFENQVLKYENERLKEKSDNGKL